MEGLSEEERKALRSSKFAPLPPPPRFSKQPPRLAHPGGPLLTNKAAALAKFLERKLQDPNGLNSLNPDLLHLAVKNAKDAVYSAGTSAKSERVIRHVDSFDDPEASSEEEKVENTQLKKLKRKKKKKDKKNKKKQIIDDDEHPKLKKRKKKLKL